MRFKRSGKLVGPDGRREEEAEKHNFETLQEEEGEKKDGVDNKKNDDNDDNDDNKKNDDNNNNDENDDNNNNDDDEEGDDDEEEDELATTSRPKRPRLLLEDVPTSTSPKSSPLSSLNTNEDSSVWEYRTKDKVYFCKVCQKDVSKLRSSLINHSKSKGHNELLKKQQEEQMKRQQEDDLLTPPPSGLSPFDLAPPHYIHPPAPTGEEDLVVNAKGSILSDLMDDMAMINGSYAAL